MVCINQIAITADTRYGYAARAIDSTFVKYAGVCHIVMSLSFYSVLLAYESCSYIYYIRVVVSELAVFSVLYSVVGDGYSESAFVAGIRIVMHESAFIVIVGVIRMTSVHFSITELIVIAAGTSSEVYAAMIVAGSVFSKVELIGGV